MARVKIILEGDETQEQVENDLFKAMNYHLNGDAHTEEKFDDPAVQDVCNLMEREHKKIYSEMLQEIFQALEKEHSI